MKVGLNSDINPIQNNAKAVIHCEAPLIDKRVVKSSSGFREQRYVIKTKLENWWQNLGNRSYVNKSPPEKPAAARDGY